MKKAILLACLCPLLASAADLGTTVSIPNRVVRADKIDLYGWATNYKASANWVVLTNFDDLVNTQLQAEVDTIVTNETTATINAHAAAITNWATLQAWVKINDRRWQNWRDYEIDRRKDERDWANSVRRAIKKWVRYCKGMKGE